MKPKLIVLSDLWGFENAYWLTEYCKKLNTVFEVKIYDSCILGNVNVSNTSENKTHKQFVEWGIATAVEKLLTLENKKVTVLAFSIGGVIAWKAALKGLQFDCFYAVSSTRLRYETQKPDGILVLHYGEDDPYKPNQEWFDKMHVNYKIHASNTHTMYTQNDFVNKLSCEIIERSQNCL